MSTGAVLSAAAALRRFTSGQLAAYCDEDTATIEAVLGGLPDAVEALPGGAWRVRDPAALRQRVRPGRRPAPNGPRRRPAQPAPTRAAAGLLLAEKMLLDCAGEPDPRTRLLMAATAHNHLRRCAAALAPGSGAWWQAEQPDRLLLLPEVRVATEVITGSRLRLDLALARFTGSEAGGDPVGTRELLAAAREVDALPAGMAAERRTDLSRRLVGLFSRILLAPYGGPGESAPIRFLATVAVSRAGEDGTHLARVLDGLASELTAPGGQLFRVIDQLPAGRARVAVYADLLPLLPVDCYWDRTDDPLPGALVEGVADDRARRHLGDGARLLETGLDGFPYRGGSALIGRAAHLLEDLALMCAEHDDTVLTRAADNRRGLLSLVGAPVR
jgi:hypothetical protein